LTVRPWGAQDCLLYLMALLHLPFFFIIIEGSGGEHIYIVGQFATPKLRESR
jgi:hypothetical protein